MNIEQKARELVNLCGQAPQETNNLLTEGIKTQLIAMRIFEQGWENIGGLPKKLEISTLLTTEDLRDVTLLYLQRCSEEALFSLLGLDVWQTAGEKEEACQRIIDCLFSSDVGLDLKDLQLSNLPNAIGQLSHLRALQCSNNQLTCLPETIDQLSNLELLTCSNNRLTSLPETINQLPHLKLLECCSNQLTSLPEVIGQLSHLQFLDCSNNQLTYLPAAIGQLSNLKKFYCSSNELTLLPEVIGQLSNLEVLACSHNRLTLLPETINQLSRLELFSCASNQLTLLPEVIGQLSNLQLLDCSNNQLTLLPDTIGKLSNLRKLNCSMNLLNSLSETIGQLSHLESFSSASNRLTFLPETLGSLSNLQSLDCSNNRLTLLPDTIGKLSHLKRLYCSSNQLTSLPEVIGQLSHLEVLNCSMNRLNSLSEAIGQLSHLEFFNCSTNQLTLLPQVIGQLSNLRYLDCSNNRLTLLPEQIAQLCNLKKLNCSMNLLISLPKAVSELSNLNVIDCSNNWLTSLPETIGQLSNLQQLHCFYNPTLTGIQLDIFNLSSHCTIDITNTGLSQSVLLRIQERISNPDYTGPIIHYNIREDASEEEKSLDELLNTLYTHLGQKVPEKLHILSEDPIQTENFSNWLKRLSWTADGQNIEESKKGFYTAITDIIEFAASNQNYREFFHTILVDASITCGDRITLSIVHLEIAKQEITVDKRDLPALADFLKRGYLAMQLLKNIAQEKTLTLRFFDEVEVYLAYPIKLKEALNLPFSTEKMRFMCHSGVTDEDLKLAQQLVETELNNQNAVVNFLIKNNTWIEALKERFPEKFETIQQAAIEEGEDPIYAYRALTLEAIFN